MATTPSSLRLDPDLFDPSWVALPNDKGATGGLSFASTQIRNNWIVRLDFRQNSAPKGEKSHGTGFYVNIPDTKAHVILTAAHNLVDNQKKPSQDLQFYDPLQGAIIKPGDLEIFIPPSYLSRPRTETDFGAIRVPTSTSVPRGFGFALKLAEESLRDKTLQICGFPSDCPRPEPSTSSGDCKRWNRNRLEYQIATAKGLSGAPVFMPFKGHDTVIGIHTNGSDLHRGNSKGCRLSETVLEQIFHWLGVSHEEKTLRVFPSKDAPPEGLYLRFPPFEEHGWVRLGEKGLETTFDIFPAYAPTSNLTGKPTYVFRFRHPRGWPQSREKQRWVLWDYVRQVVTLTDKLEDCCFPYLVRIEPKKNSKKKPTNSSETFRIVLERKDPGNPADIGQLVEFRMANFLLKEEDIEMEEMDTPEVGFMKHYINKPAKVCFKAAV
ncbi:hypothetical protein H112_05580 [Trichophyton rubrum D6]|nr:uncharacterized protein TERG_03310 [Trichophyton rubrum CBS 118892]EZF16574.1 hypothetical protein H100_05598 [Trichophyton rubrum MR850]EZF40253.1 hypothetical protein H102_05565 [Trichophyton rubrum CBS 100081]EZF51078.1 hypothetical protein H103_05588 [Trichophyton rubrum CBS 288.86]EZF61478.1 hypothetical protein H104_05579 [Trichophyton rubrum CBS 289.86]EZF72240.1 hypothetical protein H105_05606 [Trichophyton soudanense CBS 452.61]EZF82899.1 hypothetical protein H110_05588 [Trichophy